MQVHAALHEAYLALKASNPSGEEKLEAQLLLEHALNVNHAWLIAHAEDDINAATKATFDTFIQRRMTGEPVAHLLGEREFYGLPFKVTPDTLIPRPDTETLVEVALRKISAYPSKQCTIVDLGTGSGAIALTIAKQHPSTKVTAVDASAAALKVAQENANNLSVSNVQFIVSNWFSALQYQRFDFIVSNPPYIEQNDVHLTQGDLRFEPLSALASGQDGLNDIRHIIQCATQHLNPQGWLMLEHGYNQSQTVATLLGTTGFTAIETLKDLGGNNRVTLGRSSI